MLLLCALVGGAAPPAAAVPVPVSALHEAATGLDEVAHEWSGPLGELPVAQREARRALDQAQMRLRQARAADPVTVAYLRATTDRVTGAEAVRDVGAVLRAAAVRLRATAGLSTLAPAEGAYELDSGMVRAALEQELMDESYAERGENLWGTALFLAWQRLWEWVGDRFSIGNVQALERVSYFIMFSLVAVAVLALLWWWVRGFARRPGSQPAVATTELVETRLMAEPDAYRRQAADHAAVQEYRAAVRALFLMTLAELESRDLVAYDRTRTNTEYMRQLQRRVGAGPLLEGFRSITDTYDHVWYGREACAAQDFAHFADRVAGGRTHHLDTRIGEAHRKR